MLVFVIWMDVQRAARKNKSVMPKSWWFKSAFAPTGGFSVDRVNFTTSFDVFVRSCRWFYEEKPEST